MKLSNKPNLIAGIILLLVAAFFSIALIIQPLDFGSFGPGRENFLYQLGNMLTSVYGISSILIPVFLFMAAISCFLSKWTAKKSMILLTAIIPFFTSVGIEKLCRIIAKNGNNDKLIKIILTSIIGLMLILIEIFTAGSLADKIYRKNSKKDKHSEKSEEKEESNDDEVYSEETEEFEDKNKEITENEESENEDTIIENIVSEDEPLNDEEIGLNSQNDVIDEQEVVEKTEDDPYSLANNIEEKKEDPFADVFDEDESESNNASVITQEEYAALTNFDNNDIENADSNSDEKSDDIEDSDEYEDFDTEKENDEIEWPEENEIKAKANNSEESEAFESDEIIDEENAECENTNDDNDFLSMNIPKPKNVSTEKIFEEKKDDNTDDDADGTIDNSSLEFPAKDFNKETLDPDFFDIDINEESADEIDLENKKSNEENSNESIYQNNIQLDEYAEKKDDEKNDAEKIEEVDLFEKKETALSSEIFDDMESDIRNELKGTKFKLINSEDASQKNNDNVNSQEEENPYFDERDLTSGRVGFEDFDTKKIEQKPDSEEIKENDEISEPIATSSLSNRAKEKGPYKVPTTLLEEYENDQYWLIDEETKADSLKLKETLNQFNIEAEVIGIKKGPVVTMFELAPAPGVKLSKIVTLQDNIALSLAASSVRIVAPIPGRAAVGIEVPNKHRSIVSFREMIEKDLSEYNKMAIPVILGKDILGKAQLLDLVKTPHLLIAGATGAGKSVCVNSMILSILYKRSPQQVKLILVDPKVVELKLYNNIPHLLTPVITEPKRALQSLQYCLCEMERRYALLDGMGVRDIASYNRRIDERNICTEKLPYIVVIIDEFADLMATTGKELESTIARLAAMSRAVGIHLVLATQRPSIDVITGLIKANIPTRIAFMVASKMDSRIIIDQVGAEMLLGKGDMLYASAVDPFPVRIQGTFVSDNDVENVVDYVKASYGEPDYIDDEIFVDDDEETDIGQSMFNEGADPLYEQALDIVIQSGKASASYIQRRLKIGYNRAARLVEEMEDRGIVGPANGSKPRELIHIPN